MVLTKAAIVSLIVSYANFLGFDPQVAVAVATVESGLNPKALGTKGEVGLFQVMPQYVKGFSKQDLLYPRINIMVGIMKLKEEQEKCKHKDNINYLVCYNYGRTNAKRVRYPELFPYVVKVQTEINKGVLYGKN
jgi:soluble lytic murein transglycosylase-like protein